MLAPGKTSSYTRRGFQIWEPVAVHSISPWLSRKTGDGASYHLIYSLGVFLTHKSLWRGSSIKAVQRRCSQERFLPVAPPAKDRSDLEVVELPSWLNRCPLLPAPTSRNAAGAPVGRVGA